MRLNIYLICVDKSILESRSVEDNLEPVVEFISLLFAGQFKDSRLKKHDIEFKGVADKYGEELEDMAKYYSEVEEIVAEEAARAAAEAAAKAAAEGKAEGIINMSLEFGKDKGFIIGSLTKKLNIPIEEAEEYYKMFSK